MISHRLRDMHPLRDDVAELQRAALIWIAIAASAGGFAFLCISGGSPDIGRPAVWVVIGSLALVLGGAWFLLDRARTVSAVVLSAGLIAVILVAAGVYSSRDVLFGIPLVIFVVPVLLDYRFTVGIAVLSAVAAWLLQILTQVPPSLDDVLAVTLLTGASVVLGSIAYRPTRVALDWALESSVEERRKTQDVRERQAQLAQMSKSLADACDRLEKANLALAQARQEADEARRLKEEFATAISHELRTPLNLIIGFSEMIVQEPGGDEDIPAGIRRDVDTIYRNACHLSKLVDDVLDLGRIDAHRLALQKEWVSLSQIVQDAAMAVEGLYRRAGLDLALDVPADLPLLHVDPTRIRQVLINLLANAVRYTEEGRVSVIARRGSGEVVVQVQDPGIGIPPEDLPYVFDYFRQAGHPRVHDGFGVGLTVSKRFVEMHAGSMWVTSQRGQGTTFSFSLPVADNVAAVAVTPSQHRLERHYLHGTKERTVLVLDSEAEVGHLFQRYLDGYHVLVASSPAEARRLSERETIQAIVLANSNTPQGDALRVGSDAPRIPILHCALHTLARAGHELGALAFLAKPVAKDQLQAIVRQLKRSPRHAVVVDDDPAMGYLLGRMLRSFCPECRIHLATDGEQGFALARSIAAQGTLDLILLDLLMPGMDGSAFLRAWNAQAELRAVPVVIISAASEQDYDVIFGDVLEIRRRGGLTVSDVMRTVRASLDSLLATENSDPLASPAAEPANGAPSPVHP